MDEIKTILDKLSGAELEYVYARSKCTSTKEALKEAGIGKSTFYTWDNRDELEEIANQLRRNRVLLAEPKLHDAIEQAVDVLVELLESDKDMVKLNAAKTIMDRVMGMVTAKVDLTSAGEKIRSAPVEDMMALFQALGQREQQKRQADNDEQQPANIISE